MSILDHPSNRPAAITPERPARVVATLVIRPGRQGIAPVVEADFVCDDNKIRRFVWCGKWVEKKEQG